MDSSLNFKRYVAWIICGDGGIQLPEGDNPNLVGQFIVVLNSFWMNWGVLFLWYDNHHLTYEANKFLEKVFFCKNKKSW